MAERTPADHEARLRAMTAGYPDYLAWGLDPQDRAAIRWALDELGRLRAERDKLIESHIYDFGPNSRWGIMAFEGEKGQMSFDTWDEAVAYVRGFFGLPEKDGPDGR